MSGEEENALGPGKLEATARPLITFALFSYNQQAFIKEAVEAAFAQDYQPLEIIISDDCSTDATYSIIQELMQRYAGSHRVIARRNELNHGLISHINKVFDLAKGEWIVVAAGDDISVPERVSEVVKAARADERINLVSSALTSIDSKGVEMGLDHLSSCDSNMLSDVVVTGLPELLAGTSPYAHGATLAYSRKLIDAFPPAPADAVYEDAIYKFRSALAGWRAHIDKPLVKYRISSMQTTNLYGLKADEFRNKQRNLTKGAYITATQHRKDISSINSTDVQENVLLKTFVSRKISFFRMRYYAVSWPWPFRIAALFLFLLKRKGNDHSASKSFVFMSLLPKQIYEILRALSK